MSRSFKSLKAAVPAAAVEWIEIVEQNDDSFRVSNDQIQMMQHLDRCFENEDLYIDAIKFEKYISLIEAYFPYRMFPWQKFMLCMHLTVYQESDRRPRWPNLFTMIGRGSGKDGTIAMEALCLSSPVNGIPYYNVDICATQEEQAVRPVKDLKNFFERPAVEKKIRKFYHWTNEIMDCKQTKSVIKGHTNNPKGRDGLRPGIVVFNEVHAYENYANIKVFKTGKGKVPEPREAYFTSNGEVRGAVLDDMLEDARATHAGERPDRGWIYFICRLDTEDEIDDQRSWAKANPSLPYLPELLQETKNEYYEWKENPNRNIDFPIKRMGLSKTAEEACAAEWDDILATNKELPDLSGRECTCGIDFAKTTDWVGVNLHFNIAGQRYDINHAWVCAESKDLKKIKAPWQEWAEAGLLTVVHDIEIAPEVIADYIQTMRKTYRIRTVAIDSYRVSLMSKALAQIGYTYKDKNLVLIKNRDIIQAVPVIDHLFIRHLMSWGDNPMLRWATNNTKTIRYGRKEGADKGSFVYAKIDSERRKTDPFMALVASVCVELDAAPEDYKTPKWLDISF